jgi:hypothetical protein
MPAINVARTDTFEQQRTKINQIGQQIFTITEGGSDLSTGNLKLGDGSKTQPSLSFVNDASVGIYRPGLNTMGFVSGNKNIFQYNTDNVSYYQDLILTKRSISTDQDSLLITNSGSNYDPGLYQNITLIGGSGTGALADIEVVEFSGTSTLGTGYFSGTFNNILLNGGSGSGASINFTIDSIVGSIIQIGSNYTAGTFTNVPLTGGSGTGAQADITVSSLSAFISSGGSSYPDGTFIDIPLTGGSGSGARANIDIFNGIITSLNITSSGVGYSNTNVLGVSLFQAGIQNIDITVQTGIFNLNGNSYPGGISLIYGKTYEFNQVDSSNDNYPLCIGTILDDTNSALGSLDGVTYVVNGITYNNFSDYASNISPGDTERKVIFNVPLIPATDNLFFFTFNQFFGSSLTLNADSGSGAAINVTSIPGEIENLSITYSGSGYLENDVLSATIGGGSGFQFRITNQPGVLNSFEFFTRGTGYSVSDVLTLPGSVSGITSTLSAAVRNISASLTAASPTITVSSTAGISPGYIIQNVTGPGAVVSGTTVSSINGPTSITMDRNPDFDGSAVLDFVPPNPREIVVSDATGISPGSFVTVTSGSGSLPQSTTVVSASGTTVVLSADPTSGGSVTLQFNPPYGPGTGWSYTINKVGSIESIAIDPDNTGVGYVQGDILSISPFDLSSPITYEVTSLLCQEITLIGNINQASSGLEVGSLIEVQGSGGAGSEIYKIYTDQSGNIVSLIVPDSNFQSGDTIVKLGTSTTFIIDTAPTTDRFFIDTGSGPQVTPNLTFYLGDTYTFDLSDPSLASHQFSLSKFKDGRYSPSLIENVNAILDTGIRSFTVIDTSNILVGMSVTVVSGTASLSASVTVESVDSPTQLTLTELPLTGGSCVLSFSGVQYSTGIERTATSLSLKVTEDTPTTLYYYCEVHPDMGGSDGLESEITISPNNPRVFGSGFTCVVDNLVSSDIIFNDISEGRITCEDLRSESCLISDGEIDNLQSTSGTFGSLTSSSLSSSGNTLNISSSTLINFSTNRLLVNDNAEIKSNGDIETSGKFKSSDSLVINNILTITESVISTSSLRNITLRPSPTRTVKVDSNTAIVIPSGGTNDRPSALVVEDGAIRFNTDTNQYEGYTSSTNSWSSLGGIRDLDGNTYVLAEESVGSNDNTFWFYNDNVNTIRLTTSHLDFRSVKKIKSSNINAPSFTNWAANTPVTVGEYIAYRNNLYVVTYSGTTATSGNEPTHISGAAINGTAELTWYSLSVAPITIEDCAEFRIGPDKDVPLVISSELRFLDNVLSTESNDFVIRPNSGKKVIIDSGTTLAVPSGPDTDRGVPIAGSLRFSTTTSQFEGYDGANWGSLGGVKDVDQNTYIIPELSPGSNENILYFYNDNNNTLQLSTTSLDFYSVDTIRSVTSDELEITASLLTFDGGASTFDNTDADRTFLHTTKQYFDLGLSAGLTTDPVLRLDDQGDVYLNIGFGTGVYNGVKVFDGDLKEFELADVKILTEKLTLVKGTSDNGSSVIYAVASNAGAKTTIVAENPTSGDKEFIEFGILDDGTDVFHTEYGNIRTGTQLIVPTFEVTGAGDVRINIALGSAVNPTEAVNITVVSNITKK